MSGIELKELLDMVMDGMLVKELLDVVSEKVRKETAKEIIDMLVPPCERCDENWHKGCLCLRATIAEKIAKQYDLEEE